MSALDLETVLSRPLTEKHPPGVFLDGVKLNALGTLAPQEVLEEIKELGGPFECYVFPIGRYMLAYYLCPNSCVEVDSSRYLTLQQDEDEDVEDLDYCQVVFKDTISQRCTFEGECELVNVWVAESHLASSELILGAAYNSAFHIYIRLELIESEAHNAFFSHGAVIMGSSLEDVEVVSFQNEKVRIDQCEMQFSRFSTDGMIQIEHVYAQNTHVHMKGVLKLACLSWVRTRITGESINITGPMYFLEVTLPRVKFFVYRTGADKWAIAPDLRGDRFSIDVDAPDIEDKLRAVLKERWQTNEESCLQYIYDSIESRIKVMEAIELYRHQEYLRLSAVC